MVAASRRLCNMFAFCRCYCPGLLGSLALSARPFACSCLYQSSPPELENSPLLLCASFNIMWIYTDACACVCVYVFAHECCACVLRMHKCVVLTYASGPAGFFRAQVCTCIHAYLYMYICMNIYVVAICSQVLRAFPSCLPLQVCCTVSVMVVHDEGNWGDKQG